MAFDPDAYLAQPSSPGGFDPDAYLGIKKQTPAADGSFPELSGVLNSDKSPLQKIWAGMQVPSQMSKRGLEGLAEATKPNPEITGNMPRDLLMNFPSTEFSIAAKAAPGFIDRTSMLLGGLSKGLKAAAPIGKVIGGGVASQLESLSGMKPGLMGKAFQDPSLIMATIPQEARDAYQAENAALQTSDLIKNNPNPMALINAAKKAAAAGNLSPGEAMEARKAVDQLYKSNAVTPTWKDITRKFFDAAAKEKDSIAEADTAFSRGKQAAGLRQLLPQNKYGGTSAFKLGIVTALAHMGVPGQAALAMMSPAAMGATASLAGAAAPVVTNPAATVSINQLIQQLKNKYDNRRQF